jgi:hypothetical protein
MHEQEKMKLTEAIDSVRNESNKDSDQLQVKLKEAERAYKALNDKSKKERNMLETENEKLDQTVKHLKEANDRLQEKNQFMLVQQEQQQHDLERQLKEQGEEAVAERMASMTQQHTLEITSLEEKYQNEKK